MNPYLSFALAMCAIVLVSLGATAYLAMKFNRAAKRDLEAALSPLARVLDGDLDLDEAQVTGRYDGHLASGQVVHAPSGQGRAFQTELVDAAGGRSWSIASAQGGTGDLDWQNVDPRIKGAFEDRAASLSARYDHPVAFRLEYVADAGCLRLIKPMRTRRDIPEPEAFAGGLDTLVALGPVNRAVQGAPNADWTGGRSPSRVPMRGSERE